MNRNIEFDVCGIAEVLRNHRLRVPPNQREYSWQTDQVMDLLQDVGNAIRDKAPSYFLGTIVLTKSDEGDFLEVADGQQRLATATIILSHFRDIFLAREAGDLMRVNSIETDFLFTIDFDAKEKLPKLTLNIDDNQYFSNAILERPHDRKTMKKSYMSHELINNAKNVIKSYFEGALKQIGDNNFTNFLSEWRKYLQENASVVVLRVIDAANAFVMFETLNDRGLKTSQADLVKNYLFQKSGDRLTEAQGHWTTMRGVIESIGDNDLIMEYLRLCCCVISGATRDKDVMDRFTGLAQSKGDALRLLVQLGEMASDYAAILNTDHLKWNNYNYDVRQAIQDIGTLGVKQIRPLMLSVARHFNESNTEAAFKVMVSWSVRFLVEGVRGGRLDDLYARLANEIYRGSIKTADELKKAAAKSIPTDSQFKSSFETARVGTARLARYYLRSMETTARGEKQPQLIVNPNTVINLEHIIPEKPEDNWPNISQQDIETHFARLGNMVLLQAVKNSQLGSQAFDVKREVYRASTLLLTSQVADFEKWGIDEINKRQKNLASIAVDTWPL